MNAFKLSHFVSRFSWISRISKGALVAFMLSALVSCTTTYDRAGRPVQSVDPAAATVGVVAAGLIAYSLAKSDNCGDKKKRYGRRSHYGYGTQYGYGCNQHHGRHHNRYCNRNCNH